ncbi:MAG: hypothetical protein ABI772_11315 [Bacteroidota bacterium]
MNEEEHLKTLSDIKGLMERSSRFLSLSGLSGIFIGFYALAGSIAAWWFVNNYAIEITSYYTLATNPDTEEYKSFLSFFMGDALIVLALSLITGYILTQRFARKQGLKMWDTSAKRMVINLFIPLVTGGIYCLILLQNQHIELIASSLLMFYGLSLLNASKYTFNDIRYLGILEILLGLIAAMFPGYGIICWAIGFGILHIIYGISMYYKYER